MPYPRFSLRSDWISFYGSPVFSGIIGGLIFLPLGFLPENPSQTEIAKVFGYGFSFCLALYLVFYRIFNHDE